MQAIALSLFRHVATLIGGAFVTQGTLTGGEVETAVGALVTLASIAWAAYSRYKVTQKENDNGR